MDPPGEYDPHHRAFSTLRESNADIRGSVALIRDNDSSTTSFYLRYLWERELNTSLPWQLIGRYIANNTHLKSFHICYNFTSLFINEKMAVLFGELVSSNSIERIDLSNNRFGTNGFRCMVPFLKSTRLMHIDLSCNFLGNECFELLIHALDEKPIKELKLGLCRITDISALNTNTLPQLETLDLDYNEIGNAGIVIVSSILQKESRLTTLNLSNTDIDDEGAELLADSLKHNTTLEYLSLNSNNGITEIGCIAFLKLVNDVSSIKNTYSSNHTLKSIGLANSKDNDDYPDTDTLSMAELYFMVIYDRDEIKSLVEGACGVDSDVLGRVNNRIPEAACRAKIIKYQLHSQRMEMLCRFQGIRYSPGNIFAGIEPVLLPKILALIGNEHGQSELYTALIHTAPDLLSYIDRKALIQNALANVEANFNGLAADYERAVTWYERKVAAIKIEYLNRISHLGAQKANLGSRLALLELGNEAEKKASQQYLPPLVEDSSAYDFNDAMANLQMSHDEYVFPWSEGSNPDDDQRHAQQRPG